MGPQSNGLGLRISLRGRPYQLRPQLKEFKPLLKRKYNMNKTALSSDISAWEAGRREAR